MSGKRVLVVDDSKSARVILRKMLEQYELQVDTTESAEEALDYLRHRRPDAIFMDHMMPGMDGLEAVRIIKDDPKTATIPIMMYTSKEGEVYVGQARALGAVGILPKQVEPAELFNILRRINLVPERRSPIGIASEDGDVTELGDAPGLPLAMINEISRIAVETAEVSHSARHAQLKQLFETQREHLQQDLEDSRRDAREYIQRELGEQLGTGAFPPLHAGRDNHRRWAVPTGLVLFACLFFSPAIWQSAYFDSLESELVELRSAVAQQQQANAAIAGNEGDWPTGGPHHGGSQGPMDEEALLHAIEWALNRGGTFGVDGPALGDSQKEMLQGLLSYLASAGFRGEVRLGVRFGEFCLVRNAYGTLEMAPADMPVEQCDVIGRLSDPGPELANEQTVSFGSFLASSPLVTSGDIRLEIYPVSSNRADDRNQARRDSRTAGDWNRMAQLDNRLEISLVPEDTTE